MKNHPSRRNAGFTLVELLIVIAIIAVIVALSSATIIKMRKSADKLNAGNSLKQLQISNASYAADHNGKYVPVYGFDDEGRGSFWPNNPSFLASLFGNEHVYKDNGQVNLEIPIGFLDKAYVQANSGDQNVTKFFGGPYGYNHTTELAATGVSWGSAGSHGGTRATQIKNPAKTFAFALSSDWICRYSGRFTYLTKPTDKSDSSGLLAFRYGNKVPIVFYDGHVEYLSPDDIKKFDEVGGEAHPFWNGTSGS
jgi:prepilin-type N-terminal cleavage/methylation domain-containing protein/prepilin-type processing-associated H-X9-DG protein